MDISPDKQNIDGLFATTTYHIDFYQRDYKWTSEPVARLLDDIFYAFDVSYQRNVSLDPGPETVSAHYPWYYLNTYVTNTIDGRVYVVDGQQRLTTITLILIGLLHRTEAEGSDLSGWVRGKIAGQAGFKNQFWMNHEGHLKTLEALFKNAEEISINSGLTAKNMVENYDLISAYLEKKIDSKHKLETFVFYFLQRLVLINLSGEQTDVPMVFEVINDRGVRLRPYEILKGKLLGQIDKIELDKENFSGLWEKCVARVNRHKAEEIDTFFIYFLKAKFTESRSNGQRFDNDYHREIFKPTVNDTLKLERNPIAVKDFLKDKLDYYTRLYSKIWEYSTNESIGYEALFFNGLNEMDSQFMLILSACSPNDQEEAQKIKTVAAQVDRLFVLLRLQRAYDSNNFNDAVFDISKNLRDRPASEIEDIFDEKLNSLLAERRGAEVETSFEYAQFRNTSINDIPARFTRYFFARIDRFIAERTNTAERHPISDLVMRTGPVNGFHIEHIMSRNSENTASYGDDDAFEIDRNRLGAVLLLKGRDNISSGNESFKKKLKSYANTLHWNETLREDSYKSKKDFESFVQETGLSFEPYQSFGRDEVEKRHRLLFDIASQIWS